MSNGLTRWLSWPPRLVGFAGWYAWTLVKSNLRLMADILTPGQASTPGILRLPLRSESDFEVTLIASLISLTPGTLTLAAHDAASENSPRSPRTIYVHGMYSPDRGSLTNELYEMESRMLAAVRRAGLAESDRAERLGGGP